MEIPERVWLQTGEDAADGAADGPTMHNGEMTWCEDRIYKHDTEYVRSDLYAALQSKLQDCEDTIDRADEHTAMIMERLEAAEAKLHEIEQQAEGATEYVLSQLNAALRLDLERAMDGRNAEANARIAAECRLGVCVELIGSNLSAIERSTKIPDWLANMILSRPRSPVVETAERRSSTGRADEEDSAEHSGGAGR